MEVWAKEAIKLLQKMIATPSLSRNEEDVVQILIDYFESKDLPYDRIGNNLIVKSMDWEDGKPTLLLNSHVDTVKPASTYTRNPHSPDIEGDILYGLGSNDAGGCLVSLLMTFQVLQQKKQPYNLVFIASAEEEVSGKDGISLALSKAPKIDFGVVGEPTQMHLAIAEKGLLVVDGTVKGKSGHAARNEGDNAIYKALKDVEWFSTFQFAEVSKTLGPVKTTVTGINAGTQHNVVPDTCTYMVDIRTNEKYTNEEVLEVIQKNTIGDIVPRSVRLNSSFTPENHAIIKRANQIGRKLYGSPTLSDQAQMPFSTVKLGPGDSARSHTADEYIKLSEIEEGIQLYVDLLDELPIK